MVLFSLCWHIKLSVTFVPLNNIKKLPSERNQYDVVFLSFCYQMFGLLMTSDINNVIDNSWKLRVAKIIQLLHWMAMWMENTRVFVCYDFIDFSFYSFNELRIFDWRISGNLFLSLWCGVNIDSNSVFDPFFKLGHFLSRKLIPATWDMNASVVI